MLLSFTRRFLALLLAAGVLAVAPVSAYDSDYEDEEQEVKKSRKKKKKKKSKKKSEEDYWDEDTWEDDEVEPVVKKKKSRKKSKKKAGKAKKESRDDEEDSWDDVDTESESVTAEDEEDFFSEPTPAEEVKVEPKKTAMGRTLQPAPLNKPTPTTKAEQTSKRDPRAECIAMLNSGSSEVDYVEFEVVHPSWTAPVRVNKEHHVLVAIKAYRDSATVLELTERELRIKWDKWGEERFLRQANGSYMHESLVKRGGEEMSRKAKRVATRLLGRKAVAWEDYGWTGRIMDYICGNEPPLTYEIFRMVSGAMDTKVRFSEAEKVLVRTDEGHVAATVLDYTGVKLHVRWESGEVETYKRLEDGSYRKIDDERVAQQLLDPDKSSREKSEDDWFQIWWRDVMDEEKPLTYVTVEMKKGSETYRPRISMDNRVLMQMAPHSGWAKVIQYDRKQLIIRWNGTREELYERGGDNVYYYVR